VFVKLCYWKCSGDRGPHVAQPCSRCRWVVNVTPQSLYPLEETAVPIENEAGWSPEAVWAFWTTEKSLAPTWFRTPDCPPCSLASTTSTRLQAPFCNNKSCHLVANYPCFRGTHSCSFWEVGNSVPVQKTFCFADRTYSWPADLELLGRGNPQLPTDLKLPGTGTHSYHQASNYRVQEPTVNLRPLTAWYRNPKIPTGLKLLGTRTQRYQQASNCLVQEPIVTIRPQTAWYRNPTIPTGLELPGTGTRSYHQASNCLVQEPTFTTRPWNFM
jgi:hypothetical protein